MVEYCTNPIMFLLVVWRRTGKWYRLETIPGDCRGCAAGAIHEDIPTRWCDENNLVWSAFERRVVLGTADSSFEHDDGAYRKAVRVGEVASIKQLRATSFNFNRLTGDDREYLSGEVLVVTL